MSDDTNNRQPTNGADQTPTDPIREAMDTARAQGIPILVDLGDDRVILVVPAHGNRETSRQIINWMFGLKPKLRLLPPAEDTDDTPDETQDR